MLRIALCEDECQQTQKLLSMLELYRSERPDTAFTVNAFESGEALLTGDGGSFDLYLLDIMMPGLNGIALARKLRETDAEAAFIFLTSSADYALEAFTVSAFQYLLKPIAQTAFFTALDKIAADRERDEGRFLIISAKERTERVAFSDVVCVELDGRVLRVVVKDGQTLFSKTVRVPFASAIAPLLTDGRFLYAHKSYVLNMARVRVLTPRSFIMESGDEIPIPRSKFTEAKNRYFDYLSAHGVGLLGGDMRAR